MTYWTFFFAPAVTGAVLAAAILREFYELWLPDPRSKAERSGLALLRSWLRLQVRVLPAPPRSPAQLRFPGALGIVFNSPRLCSEHALPTSACLGLREAPSIRARRA
jgi:hypothetical protein